MRNSCSELPRIGLATYLEEQINRKTAGRIHGLRVFRLCPEEEGNRLVILGRTGSYHVRQQALSAVMEALESLGWRPETVELQIEVIPKKVCRSEPSHILADPDSVEHGRGYLWSN